MESESEPTRRPESESEPTRSPESESESESDRRYHGSATLLSTRILPIHICMLIFLIYVFYLPVSYAIFHIICIVFNNLHIKRYVFNFTEITLNT